MSNSIFMPGISVVKFDGNVWYVRITRRNGTTYRVTSEDRQSIEDYQKEFLEIVEQKKGKTR